MLIKKPSDIRSSDITAHGLYLRRRDFLAGGAAAAAGLVVGLSGCKSQASPAPSPAAAPSGGPLLPAVKKGPYGTTEQQTPFDDVTTYNNFYELGTDKSDPSKNAGSLRTRPWTVKCEGEVGKPQTIDIDALLKLFPLEERVYRLRCVEAWSMVIPWVGFPLASLLKRLEPTSKAKFVAFETLMAPDQFPGQRRPVLDWPYVEGLRMDEAMHPLTILAVGL